MKKLRLLKFLFLFLLPLALHSQGSDIVVLGSAIVDHHMFISDQNLAKIDGPKGGWEAVDLTKFETLLGLGKTESNPGGSAMNVARTLSRLGIQCSAIGQAGPDEEGKYYIEDLQRMGIHCYFATGTLPTGRSLCLVTPDGQRTMKTYIGAAHETNHIELSRENFEGAQVFHLEGYQILDPELVTKSIRLAKQEGLKISMDLGSTGLIESHREFLLELIEKDVDILFANHQEAQALTGYKALKAADHLSKWCEIVVVTMSEKGGIVRKGSEQIFYKAKPIEHVCDTTGAGDSFASGFLFGYLSSLSIEKSAAIGAEVASYIIQHPGTLLSIQEWNAIKQQIATRFF